MNIVKPGHSKLEDSKLLQSLNFLPLTKLANHKGASINYVWTTKGEGGFAKSPPKSTRGGRRGLPIVDVDSVRLAQDEEKLILCTKRPKLTMLFYYVKVPPHSSPPGPTVALIEWSFEMRYCMNFYLNWHRN